jgi:hypothetical protein
MLAKTRQPRDANRSAVARPIPDELPVIRIERISPVAPDGSPMLDRYPTLSPQQNRHDDQGQ